MSAHAHKTILNPRKPFVPGYEFSPLERDHRTYEVETVFHRSRTFF